MARIGQQGSAGDKTDADDERAAFHVAIAGVTPLRETYTQRVSLEPPKPKPRPRRRPLDVDEDDEGRRVIGESEETIAPGDAETFLRGGAQRRVLRDLRRGRWVIESQLDLHGLTRHQAHEQVLRFIAAALSAEQRCVCIVHGHGYGSPGQESVLRPLVKSWLARHREVLAFCHAPLSGGGNGALWVLFKTHR